MKWLNGIGNPMMKLMGQDLTGIGEAVADDKEAVAASLLAYLQKVPRYAKYLQVSLDADGEPDPEEVARAAQDKVMIRIQLV